MISAYAVALKHKLRFEPGIQHDDLINMVGHLDTYAKHVEKQPRKKQNVFKTAGSFLGVPMAESNPRKLEKISRVLPGNLPLEILSHMSSYMKHIYDNGTFKVSIYQTQSLNALTTMNDVLTGTDRILNTPLPIAYSIAIGQITWVYILLLPFQLYKALGWVTIPASIFAAYIILGIALIGREIENPFGDDVNDLPLDAYCEQIRKDVDIIMSKAAPVWAEVVARQENQLLYPLSHMASAGWADKSVGEIRDALAMKPGMHFHNSHGTAHATHQHEKAQHKTDAHKAEEGGAGPGAAPGAAAAGDGGGD
jgi:hypothetical protein